MIRLIIVAVVLVSVIFVAMHRHADESTNLLKRAGDLTYWRWNQGGASGGVYQDKDAIRCDIVRDSGNDADLNLFQSSAALYNGHTYRVKFASKSDKSRTIRITAEARKFAQIGLDTKVTIDTSWRDYETTFLTKASDGDGCSAPIFKLAGSGPGSVWFKDIRIEEVK